jgi:DNA-binding CsgD family transcriptional regulator/PAS domain-containing protein
MRRLNADTASVNSLVHGAGILRIGETTAGNVLVANPRHSFCDNDPAAGERMEVLRALLIEEPDCRAVFATARPLHKGQFTDDHIETFRTLVQHVTQAVRVQLRLALAAFRSACLSEALDQIPQGVIVLDSRGKIVYANSEAQLLIKKRNVLRVEIRGENECRLQGPAGLMKVVADALIPNCQTPGAKCTFLQASGSPRPIAATVVPLRRPRSNTHMPDYAAAAIFLAKSEGLNAPSQQLLRAVYNLTPAEAAVADLIADGKCPKEVARALCVAASTVRTHLNRIFAKTGVNRQIELARLIHTLPTPASAMSTFGETNISRPFENGTAPFFSLLSNLRPERAI